MSDAPPPIRREDFRFLDRLRVRWAEVDMQKIVFNGYYLMYFDTAVAGYWRALAMPYHETMDKLEGDLYVRKATLEYLGSARYDDMLEVGIRCGRIGNSSMVFTAADVLRGGQCLVHGDLVYVFADPKTQTSRPVPAPLRQVLQGYEAGEAMLQVQLGTWLDQGHAARAIRDTVFVQEQGIAAELIVDDADPGALHAVAVNRFGLPVGTGRLAHLGQGVSKIGRMATLASVRGAGAGQAVLAALTQASRDRGDRQLVLHAQASAVGFYLRHGFVPIGERFSEAGVEHQAMQKTL